MEFNQQFSKIKREKQEKALREQKKDQLRADLPVLNAKEIRRYRLPHKEAVVADLCESGFENTAEFIDQLITYQDVQRSKVGPGNPLWLRPLLINSKHEVDRLAKGLSTAEKAHQADDYVTEWDEILRLAAHYAFGSEDWWWLGEQLLFQCNTMDYPGDFTKQEALSNYLYGKYLLENVKQLEPARYHLDIARELSTGKSWNCKKILIIKGQQTVYIESCSLLYKALTEEANAIIRSDPARASDICTVARKRAAEACDHEGEFKALILKGKCEVNMHEESAAIAIFTKAWNCAVRSKSSPLICEALIQLGMAYLK